MPTTAERQQQAAREAAERAAAQEQARAEEQAPAPVTLSSAPPAPDAEAAQQFAAIDRKPVEEGPVQGSLKNAQPFPISVYVVARDGAGSVTSSEHHVVQPGRPIPDGVDPDTLGRLVALGYIR